MVHGKGHQPSLVLTPLTVKASILPSRSVTAVSGHGARAVPCVGTSPPVNENRTGASSPQRQKAEGRCPHDPGHCPRGGGGGRVGSGSVLVNVLIINVYAHLSLLYVLIGNISKIMEI